MLINLLLLLPDKLLHKQPKTQLIKTKEKEFRANRESLENRLSQVVAVAEMLLDQIKPVTNRAVADSKKELVLL